MVLGALMGGLSIAGGIASAIQDSQNQDALAKFQEAQFQAVKAAAIEDFLEQGADVRVRTQQERTQIAEEVRNLASASFSARGTAAAAAGSQGVGGQSFSAIQLDIIRSEQGQRSRLSVLQDFREAAAERELSALSRQAKNRILAELPGPVVKPSPLAQGLQILSGGLSGFAAGQDLSGALG